MQGVTSFQDFCEYLGKIIALNHINYNRNRNISSTRQEYYSELYNRSLAIQKEFIIHNRKDPMQIISPLYFEDKYSTELLGTILDAPQLCLPQSTSIEYIKQKEEFTKYISLLTDYLLLSKKMVEYYLQFIIDINLELIMSNVMKQENLAGDTLLASDLIRKSKHNLAIFKSNFLINASHIIMVKRKKTKLETFRDWIAELGIMKLDMMHLDVLQSNSSYSEFMRKSNDFINYLNQFKLKMSLEMKIFAGKQEEGRELKILQSLEDQCLMRRKSAINFIERNYSYLFLSKKDHYMEMFKFEFFKLNSKSSDTKHIAGVYIDQLNRYFEENVHKTIKEVSLVNAINKSQVRLISIAILASQHSICKH